MNNRGQLFFFTLMLAMVLIVFVLALTPAVSEFVTNSRNTTTWDGAAGLDCTNTSISDYDQAACVTSDLTVPYFIGIVLGLAGAVIGARVILGT